MINTVLNLIKDVLTLFSLIFFLSKLQLELLIILIVYLICIVLVQNKFKVKIEEENIKYSDSIIEKIKHLTNLYLTYSVLYVQNLKIKYIKHYLLKNKITLSITVT